MGAPHEHAAATPPRTICLHGVESTGKSVLSEQLAQHYGTIWVPEYGRTYAEAHGTEMDEAELLLIGATQDAMRAAALRQGGKFVFLDTDPLMTAAWCEMMLGRIPEVLFGYPKADLYLMLEGDVGFVQDSVRIYGEADTRARFNTICRKVLERAGVNWISIGGPFEGRFAQAVSAVDALKA